MRFVVWLTQSNRSCMIHEDTEALLCYLLTMLAKRGEKETLAFIRHEVLKGKVPYEKEELDKRTAAL